VDQGKCTGCGTCLEVCPIRYEVQLPEETARARTAYAEVTDEAVVAGIINTYRDEPGNLLPVLLDINRRFNWLPRPALEHVSDELKIPLTEILRVASFYNAFSLVPRGKHIINVCLGTGCFVKGSPRLLERMERKLGVKHGETTEDMMFTLEVVRCIGCCALAPAIRVGEATYGRVNPDQVSKIIDSYLETASL
jgi:NADH:ubiquinone oxidoreductase subunit E